MMGFGLIWLLVIAGIVAYALGWRPQFNRPSPPASAQTALEILQARYARGEISREQYEQMRRDLEGQGGGPLTPPT